VRIGFFGRGRFIRSPSFQLSIGVSVLCVPWLRWTRPDLRRPIKVNLFFPIAYIAATLFVTVIPIVASPVETGTRAADPSGASRLNAVV